MRRQPPRAGHGPCSWEERGELGFPLTQVLFRRYRKSECLDQNSRRIHGLLSDHLRLQRPVEGVSVAAQNALGDLRVKRLSIEQKPIHVVYNMSYGGQGGGHVYFSLETITSVALITATTVSPFFSFSSSALLRVITASITFCPARIVTSHITSPSTIPVIFPFI